MINKRKVIIRIVVLATVAAVMLITVNAIEVNRLIKKVDEEIVVTKRQLREEEENKKAMEAEMKQMDSLEYIEKVAREKLRMVKEDDIVLIEKTKP